MRVLITGSACAFLLLAQMVFGTEPQLYVLRIAPNWRQGIVRLDPESGVETRFADFVYDAYFGPAHGGLRLAVVSDRIIAQGAAYYDFDAASGQLLRRYPALGAPYGNSGWAFHGVAVEPVTATTLGIAPGYYGSVICPPGGSSSTGIGCQSPDVPFPGYSSQTTLSEQRVLLRRGLDPADATLSIAKIFPPDSVVGSPYSQRFPAIDVERHQLWFLLQGGVDGGSGYLKRLTAAPIGNGTLGDEVVISEDHTQVSDPPERWRTAQDFAYDPSRGSFFISYLYPSLQSERRLVRQSIDRAEAIVKQLPDGESFDSIASPATSTVASYTQLLPAVADAPGANGTYWRSDAWFFNPSDTPVDVTLRRVSRPDIVRQLTLAAGASSKIANILSALGGGVSGDGSASDAITIESSFRAGSQLSVYSRTYTPAPGGGTFGQAVPAVPSLVGYSNHLAPTTIASNVAETLPVFILDKRDSQQFRHNIGIVNTSDEQLSMHLRYAIVSGLPVDDPNLEKILVVPPHSLRQYTVEALFPQSVLESMPPYIAVTGDRPAAVWLSMVDNKTGDASFIPFTLYGVEAGPEARLAFPAVTYAQGANGTFWRTDAYGIFWTRATGGQPQQPEVNFYGSGEPCGAATQTLVASPGAPNISAWGQFWYTTFADVARQVCSSDSSYGALEVRTGSWMTMVSRTYTTRADGGTYGEILPLYPPHGWPSRHFAGIELDESVRVNVGLYNGSDNTSIVAARLYDSNGQLVVSKTITLAARASIQNTLKQLLGVDLGDGLYGLSFTTVEGPGCWPYISIVDNVTGDPTNWW